MLSGAILNSLACRRCDSDLYAVQLASLPHSHFASNIQRATPQRQRRVASTPPKRKAQVAECSHRIASEKAQTRRKARPGFAQLSSQPTDHAKTRLPSQHHSSHTGPRQSSQPSPPRSLLFSHPLKYALFPFCCLGVIAYFAIDSSALATTHINSRLPVSLSSLHYAFKTPRTVFL